MTSLGRVHNANFMDLWKNMLRPAGSWQLAAGWFVSVLLLFDSFSRFLCVGHKVKNVIDRIFKTLHLTKGNEWIRREARCRSHKFQIYAHFHFTLWRTPIKFERKSHENEPKWWACRALSLSLSLYVFLALSLFVALLICILYENSFKYLLRCFALLQK